MAAAVDCEIVTLRREPSAGPADGPALSLANLEEAVRCLSAACDAPAFATIGRARSKPVPPKRRPLSLAAPALFGSSGASGAGGWSRRGSSTSLGKPPPPVRRSSSISRPQRPAVGAGAGAGADAELPPPPAFLLQPDNDNSALAPASSEGAKVAEAVKQLTELRHTPASPALPRRSPTHGLCTFGASGPAPVSSEGRKSSLSSSGSELFREAGGGETHSGPPTPATSIPTVCSENPLSSFGPRVVNDSHYGQTGFKLQQEKRYQSNTIYAQPSQIIAGFNSVTLARHSTGAAGGEPLSPLALRKNIAARSHSADRRGNPHGLHAEQLVRKTDRHTRIEKHAERASERVRERESARERERESARERERNNVFSINDKILKYKRSKSPLRLAFHDETPSLATVYNRINKFQRGPTSLTDLRERRLTVTTDDNIRAERLMIERDKRVTYQ
ncbi:hypothetical protein EVAR_21279_1 [Eumeta japonica]|uniref:Uncharacterized protein n=1 Tax=Eumeta variegata TaxID=151549 RepID=A0A4C1WL36_EUMVA|nr:hypothetical protein EVAR_21279_1 [Eumeta japonica]